MKPFNLLRLLLLSSYIFSASSLSAQDLNVLVFTKVQTGSFKHANAEAAAIEAIQEMGQSEGWTVDLTTNSNSFTTTNLSKYDAVVFNNNLGDILTTAQENAFVSYMNNGGGYVGIHAAGATETSWDWYTELIGTTFRNHPAGTPTATMNVETNAHISTSHLGESWTLNEEWYNWNTNPREKDGVQVLLTVDESTYSGGTLGNDHPISWCREYDGGRMFYTALGHNPIHFDTPQFRNHILGGIEWVAKDKIIQNSLLLDLDANSGLVLENTNLVASWKNKINSSTGQYFVKNDIGRSQAGSGRPTLKQGVAGIGGRNTIVFNEDELINFEENAFDHLSTGNGHTWVVVIKPDTQQKDGTGLANVNAFFGNLRNGYPYDGVWGGFSDDNTIWSSNRNRSAGTRFVAPNDTRIAGPQLETDQYYIVAGRLEAGLGNNVTMELFVDTIEPVSSASVPVLATTNPSKLAIGTERDATNHPGFESFDGEIARLLMYERPLSDTELQQTINGLYATYNLGEEVPIVDPPITNQYSYDFETGDLQGATITNGAFGDLITDKATFNTTGQAYNKEGNYFLSTLEGPMHDAYTGTITSPTFVLTDPVASLLVGGGASADLYFGIYLANGTEIYRTNRGTNAEPLELRTIDLTEHVGKTIYWEVGDFSTSSWGYIAVDDIRFNETPVINTQYSYDFESGDLQGATITSGAFGDLITNKATFNTTGQAYNKEGDYFLSTLEGPMHDAYTGTITSQTFVLTDPVASILVGGGSSPDLYFGIYLANGTEIYTTNRGINSEPLELRIIDLTGYVGETIYWEIGDLSTSGWGYIAVDDIRFNENNTLTSAKVNNQMSSEIIVYPN